MRGDYERAKTLSAEALEVAHESEGASAGFAASALINLGIAALGLGEHERAMESFQEALLVSQDMGVRPQVIESLERIASLAGALGKDTRAAHLWGAAETAREVTGIALSSGERSLHEPYLLSARRRLGEAAWEEVLTKGQSMSLEEAAEYALAKEEIDRFTPSVPERMPVGEPRVELTPREEEIATLVARGLTNRQISTRLSISERTAGNHVGNIFGKLDLHSRAQIATWVIERQLPTSRRH